MCEDKYGLICDMDWININNLIVDPRYQRTTKSTRSQSNIQKIVEGFEWAKFSPLTVTPAEKENFYNIIDGQHRFEAAKILGDIEELPCWIVPQSTIKEQATVFVDINKNRVCINPYEIYKAEVAKGDEKAVKTHAFCEKNDIIIPNNSIAGAAPNVTNALGTIKKYVNNGNEDNLAYVIDTIRKAFPFKSNQLRSDIINTLVSLRVEHGDRINQNILIDTLRSFEDVANIAGKAKDLAALDTTIKKDVAFKKIILGRYKERKNK